MKEIIDDMMEKVARFWTYFEGSPGFPNKLDMEYQKNTKVTQDFALSIWKNRNDVN